MFVLFSLIFSNINPPRKITKPKILIMQIMIKINVSFRELRTFSAPAPPTANEISGKIVASIPYSAFKNPEKKSIVLANKYPFKEVSISVFNTS